MSARAILDLYDAGHRTQAIELARCLGGEVERLVLAMHRADRIRWEIMVYRDLNTMSHLGADRYWCLYLLLSEGHEHWENRYVRASADLLALEAA